MPGHPRELIVLAERRFPVRIRVSVPPDGFGHCHSEMTEWLDQNCGADGWAMTPSGVRGMLKDAVSIYFLDATLAGAFVARWCAISRVETADGVFRIREINPRRGSERGSTERRSCTYSACVAACRRFSRQCAMSPFVAAVRDRRQSVRSGAMSFAHGT
jgi:hypothetical protein